MKRTMVVLVAAVTAGCVAPQRPYRFVASRSPQTVTADVAGALASLGMTPVVVDEQQGVVQTAWQDTGLLSGTVNGAEASIVRRYTVTVQPYPSGALVQLRADAQRCQRGAFTVGGLEVRGACEAMAGIPEAHQNEVDALGEQLETELRKLTPARAPVPSL